MSAPVLTGFNPVLTFDENLVNATPQILDADVTFSDVEGNFDGGTLTLTGLLAEDRVSLFNQGTGAGQIGLSGSDVTYGGVSIGTLTGGVGSVLTITFKAAATSAAIDALIQNLTYANVSNAPVASRSLFLNIVDASGEQFQSLPGPIVFFGPGGPATVRASDLAAPTLVDMDGDGDQDVLVGSDNGQLAWFRNDGTPFFVRQFVSDDLIVVDQAGWTTPTAVDLDGDGDQDLVIGNNAGTFRTYFNNAGTWVRAQGADDPFNGVDVGSQAAPVFFDVDDDGDLDAVIGTAGDGLKTFRNDGGSFVELTGAANPFASVNVSYIAPAFIDLDGDRDMDLVLGTQGSGMISFRNDGGTWTRLEFQANPFHFTFGMPFSDFYFEAWSRPFFGDIDGDSDLDLLFGDASGDVRFVLNDSEHGDLLTTVNVTSQTDRPLLAGLATVVGFDEDVVNAAPQLLDANVAFTSALGDFNGGRLTLSGLLAEDRASVRNEGIGAGQIGLSGADVTFGGVIIGTLAGGNGGTLTISFNSLATSAAIDALIQNLTYANVSNGPAQNRSLVLNVIDAAGEQLPVLDAPATFGDPYVDYDLVNFGNSGFSRPSFLDFNNDGHLDALIGNWFGEVRIFYGQDGNFGSANLPPGNLLQVSPGNAAPAAGDLDSDGTMEVVIGNAAGSLRTFKVIGGNWVERFGADNPLDGIAAGTNSTPSFADLDGDLDMDLVIGAADGTLAVYRNTAGSFVALTGAANPFNGIDVGDNSSPTFADLDGDGDQDALVGTKNGLLLAFRNNGATFTPLTGAANPFSGINYGDYSAPSFADIDGDNDLDLVVGFGAAYTTIFTNTSAHGVAIAVNVTKQLDILSGGSGNDNLVGSSDPDVLRGLAGLDTLTGNGGADTLEGGAGNDWYRVDNAGDVIVEVAGEGTADRVLSSVSFVLAADHDIEQLTTGLSTGTTKINLTGNALAQSITGNAGVNLLRGLAGADTLTGLGGNDTLEGGTGNDWYGVGNAGDLIVEVAGEGTADRVLADVSFVLAADDDIEQLTTGRLTGITTINLTGNELAQLITGNAGVNLLRGLGGADTLNGLGGNDTLEGGTGIDSLIGGTGNDSYRVVDAADLGDVIVEVAGEGTADRMLSSVSFVLAADHDIEQLTTGLSTGTTKINLTGNALAQSITGNAGVNLLRGLAGADTLTGLGGNDTLEGGTGNDWYGVGNAGDLIVEVAGEGTADRVLADVSFVLAADDDIEQLTTGRLTGITTINLTGNELAQLITGNAGVNLLRGRGGADTLRGLDGNDTLEGGNGIDSLIGGTGNDSYRVGDAGDLIVEVAGEGTADQVLAAVSFVLASNDDIEQLTTGLSTGTTTINLTGNALAQSITGNAGVNLLKGLGGDDTLSGLDGSDTLEGGTGIDSLIGGTGNDSYRVGDAGDLIVEVAGEGTADRVLADVSFVLAADDDIEQLTTARLTGTTAINLTGNALAQSITGNAGVNLLKGLAGGDTLNGLGGSDTLDGGTGADRFVFNTTLGAANIDLVIGYSVLADVIHIENAVFAGLAAGALAADAFVANTTGRAEDAEDRITYETDRGYLRFDADGLGGADGVIFARISASLLIDSGEFTVI